MRRGKVAAVIDWDLVTSSIGRYWYLSLALHDFAFEEFLGDYGLGREEVRRIAPIKDGDDQKLEHYRVRIAGALDLNLL
jgi:hypothetical protein